MGNWQRPLASLGSGSPVPHSHSHGLPPPAPNGLPESTATPGTWWNLPAWDHRRDSAIPALMSHLGDRAEPRVPRGGKPWLSTFQIIPFSHTPHHPLADTQLQLTSGREGWGEAENHSYLVFARPCHKPVTCLVPFLHRPTDVHREKAT